MPVSKSLPISSLRFGFQSHHSVCKENPLSLLLAQQICRHSLCCNNLHSPLQVHMKKPSSLSVLRLTYPLHLLSAVPVPQNAKWLLYNRIPLFPIKCILKGHAATSRHTGQNTGIPVQTLPEKSQERDLTRFSSFYTSSHATSPPFILQTQKCNFPKQSIYPHFLACSRLRSDFWLFFI